MIDEDQLRHYLASHMKDSAEASSGHHLSEAEIIQLFEQGRFAGADADKMHAHLSECPNCIATFRDVRDFYEPGRAGEVELSGAAQAWPGLQARLGFTSAPAQTGNALPWRARRFGVGLPMALAASLLLAVLCGAVWILQLKRQQRDLSAQIEVDRQSYQQQVKAAEQTASSIKEQADRANKEYQAGLQRERQQSESEKEAYLAHAKKARPNLEAPGRSAPAKSLLAMANVPIFDVFPDESIQRSGSPRRANHLKEPAGTDRFLLILNGGGQADFASYGLELASLSGSADQGSPDQIGKPIWQDNDIRRDQNGNFSLLLSRVIAPAGSYVIRIFGTSGGTRQLVAQYQMSITN